MAKIILNRDDHKFELVEHLDAEGYRWKHLEPRHYIPDDVAHPHEYARDKGVKDGKSYGIVPG